MPGMTLLAHKNENFRILNQYLRFYPVGQRFYPETFILPDDHEKYVKTHKVSSFIKIQTPIC